MSLLPVDIVLLPSDDLAQKAITVSGQLQKQGALFALGPTGPFPHASLYMTQLDSTDIDRVKDILGDIAAHTAVRNLIATRYVQEEGYVDPDYDRPDSLAKLQMKVVDAINPVRAGLRPKDQARLADATGLVKVNLEKYGYRGVGELFRPHMTLTRFANGRTINTELLPSPEYFSGQFVRLGLYEMGDNGTCIRKIAEFELGGASTGNARADNIISRNT